MTDIDFSFNGVNASAKYFYTANIIKPLQLSQIQNSIDIPKKSGLYQANKKFRDNILTIKGVVTGTSPDNLITNLANISSYLYSDSDKPLIFNNQADRYYNAQYLDLFEVLRDGNISMVDLRFLCNDPFAYAITPDTDTRTITVKDTPYTLANTGHYYAYPVITITFNDTQTHVYVSNNSIADNRFDISKAFSSGDVLEVDCKNGTIKLNGSASYAGFGDGGLGLAEWIRLATGSNSIVIGTDDSTINVTILFTYSKVYLY